MVKRICMSVEGYVSWSLRQFRHVCEALSGIKVLVSSFIVSLPLCRESRWFSEAGEQYS